MKVRVFYDSENELEVFIAQALVNGFACRGDKPYKEDMAFYQSVRPDTQLAVIVGLKRQVYRDHERAGISTLLVDKGWICPDKYFRLAFEGWHSRFMHQREYTRQRLEKLLIEAGRQMAPVIPQSEISKRRELVYWGMTPEFSKFHNTPPPKVADLSQCAKIIKHWADRVLWRPQSEVPPNIDKHNRIQLTNEKLPELLDRGAAFITWNQPQIVDAILHGLPVVDIAEDITCFPGLLNHPSVLRNIKAMPDELRWDILSPLAHQEFTLDEIRTGEALAILDQYTIKRLGYFADQNDMAYIIGQYTLMHERPKAYRGGLETYIIQDITELVRKHKVLTLLDYGSGKGEQYDEKHKAHKKWGIKPTCYDPAYPPLSKRPESVFDGVICTDVAEHVPKDHVPVFLKDVLCYAKKFVYFHIATQPAVKFLPDGRNVHLTVESPQWWMERIAAMLETLHPQAEVRSDLGRDRARVTNGRLEVIATFC